MRISLGQVAHAVLYPPMQRRMFGLWSTFSNRQLEIVINFLERSTDLAIAYTEDVSKGPPSMIKRCPPNRSDSAALMTLASMERGTAKPDGGI